MQIKKGILGFILIMSILIIGCKGSDVKFLPDKTTATDLIDVNNVKGDTLEQSQEDEQEETIQLPEGVDIDLTQLSTTMVYGEVFQMMATPTLYIDKVIRIEGEFSPYTDSATGNTYNMILIKDALACCEQGMEFILADGEYPEVGDTVIVTGEFQVYQENDYTYMHLIGAVLGE